MKYRELIIGKHWPKYYLDLMFRVWGRGVPQVGEFRFVDKDRSMNVFKEMYQSHKFFCRKSQHYCLGGWYEHEEWLVLDENSGDFILNKQKVNFLFGFPKAYCKFMWYELKDYIRYNFKK